MSSPTQRKNWFKVTIGVPRHEGWLTVAMGMGETLDEATENAQSAFSRVEFDRIDPFLKEDK